MLFGIDLGGTKIEGVVLKSRTELDVLSRLRIPTEASLGYEHILNQIKKMVTMLTESVGQAPDSLGIGTPGSLNPRTQTLKNSNTVCLNFKPVKTDLEKLLNIPVKIANDANCFAIAEALLGAVPEAVPKAEVVFGAILGTGVGGGVVVHGQVINGKQGIGGEWGHNVMEEEGSPCYCGKKGCLEMVMAGPALEKYYFNLSGQALKLPQILANYQTQNDEVAYLTIRRLITTFGRAISMIVNVLDPDAIVLGGGVGNIDLLYTEGRDEALKYIFNPEPEILLLKPKLGDSAGVFGAALL
jgi:predicted NBD/HSP70 family sugar kinase